MWCFLDCVFVGGMVVCGDKNSGVSRVDRDTKSLGHRPGATNRPNSGRIQRPCSTPSKMTNKMPCGWIEHPTARCQVVCTYTSRALYH